MQAGTFWDNPPFGIKVLVAVALFAAAYWVNDDFRKLVKSIFAPLPPRSSAGPGEKASAIEKPSAPEAKPQRNAFQRAFAFPGIGAWLGLFTGAILPFALCIALIPLEVRKGTYGMVYIFATIGIWNVLFTAFSKVRLTFLLMPIWLWSIFGVLYAIYEVRHGR